jgi:hypothetical protein
MGSHLYNSLTKSWNEQGKQLRDQPASRASQAGKMAHIGRQGAGGASYATIKKEKTL